MAHLHHPALKMLRDMTTCMPEFSTESSGVCRGCVLGKYTKTDFPSSDSRSQGVLQLIHSDLCGPMSSVSLTGYEFTSLPLMTILGRPGSISLEARDRRKSCFGSKSSKLLWRTKQERRSRYFGQTMEVGMLLVLLMSIVDRRG